MGACCAKELKDENIDSKEQKIDFEYPVERSIEEHAARPSQSPEDEEFAVFTSNAPKIQSSLEEVNVTVNHYYLEYFG